MAKRTFAARTFQARNFACGTLVRVGAEAAVADYVTTRLTLVGTSQQRYVITGQSAERYVIMGASRP